MVECFQPLYKFNIQLMIISKRILKFKTSFEINCFLNPPILHQTINKFTFSLSGKISQRHPPNLTINQLFKNLISQFHSTHFPSNLQRNAMIAKLAQTSEAFNLLKTEFHFKQLLKGFLIVKYWVINQIHEQNKMRQIDQTLKTKFLHSVIDSTIWDVEDQLIEGVLPLQTFCDYLVILGWVSQRARQNMLKFIQDKVKQINVIHLLILMQEISLNQLNISFQLSNQIQKNPYFKQMNSFAHNWLKGRFIKHIMKNYSPLNLYNFIFTYQNFVTKGYFITFQEFRILIKLLLIDKHLACLENITLVYGISFEDIISSLKYQNYITNKVSTQFLIDIFIDTHKIIPLDEMLYGCLCYHFQKSNFVVQKNIQKMKIILDIVIQKITPILSYDKTPIYSRNYTFNSLRLLYLLLKKIVPLKPECILKCGMIGDLMEIVDNKSEIIEWINEAKERVIKPINKLSKLDTRQSNIKNRNFLSKCRQQHIERNKQLVKFHYLNRNIDAVPKLDGQFVSFLLNLYSRDEKFVEQTVDLIYQCLCLCSEQKNLIILKNIKTIFEQKIESLMKHNQNYGMINTQRRAQKMILLVMGQLQKKISVDAEAVTQFIINRGLGFSKLFEYDETIDVLEFMFQLPGYESIPMNIWMNVYRSLSSFFIYTANEEIPKFYLNSKYYLQFDRLISISFKNASFLKKMPDKKSFFYLQQIFCKMYIYAVNYEPKHIEILKEILEKPENHSFTFKFLTIVYLTGNKYMESMSLKQFSLMNESNFSNLDQYAANYIYPEIWLSSLRYPFLLPSPKINNENIIISFCAQNIYQKIIQKNSYGISTQFHHQKIDLSQELKQVQKLELGQSDKQENIGFRIGSSIAVYYHKFQVWNQNYTLKPQEEIKGVQLTKNDLLQTGRLLQNLFLRKKNYIPNIQKLIPKSLIPIGMFENQIQTQFYGGLIIMKKNGKKLVLIGCNDKNYKIATICAYALNELSINVRLIFCDDKKSKIKNYIRDFFSQPTGKNEENEGIQENEGIEENEGIGENEENDQIDKGEKKILIKEI